MWLSPARARWLGYLYHAHAIGLSLSEYAQQQDLSLGELLDWERCKAPEILDTHLH